jgi:hypothetical protein
VTTADVPSASTTSPPPCPPSSPPGYVREARAAPWFSSRPAPSHARSGQPHAAWRCGTHEQPTFHAICRGVHADTPLSAPTAAVCPKWAPHRGKDLDVLAGAAAAPVAGHTLPNHLRCICWADAVLRHPARVDGWMRKGGTWSNPSSAVGRGVPEHRASVLRNRSGCDALMALRAPACAWCPPGPVHAWSNGSNAGGAAPPLARAGSPVPVLDSCPR